MRKWRLRVVILLFMATICFSLLRMANKTFTSSNTILKVDFRLLPRLTLDPQSLSGNRLIRRADIHVGHFLTQILRARRLSPGESISDKPEAFLGLATSRDGNLGFISAINERMYRRLNILQGQIINNEEQPAALNPRAYRYFAIQILN
jgi:hypothetical protein